MKQRIMLIPTGPGAGLNAVTRSLQYAFEIQGIKSGIFKPIASTANGNAEFSLSGNEVEKYLSTGSLQDLLEKIVSYFENVSDEHELTLIEGIISTQNNPYAEQLNREISNALSAPTIFVTSQGTHNVDSLCKHIEITLANYGGFNNKRIAGLIVNKINAPIDDQGYLRLDQAMKINTSDTEDFIQSFKASPLITDKKIKLLAMIPWDIKLNAPRVKDIVTLLNAKVIYPGDYATKRITHITLCARSVTNMTSALLPGALIITPGDRSDIIVATCLASLSGINIAALLLTGNYPFSKSIFKLCEQAINQGLPVLSVPTDSFSTAIQLHNINIKLPEEDIERIKEVSEYITQYVDSAWINTFTKSQHDRYLSPAAFRYQIVKKACASNKLIVLPEGNELRTLKAAAICAERHIARFILLGNPEEIQRIAANNAITLNDRIQIVDPELVREHYVAALVKARSHKGLQPPIALEQLKDNVVLATMMLYNNEVDGLVSGAVHTTANTIRPALQIIKTDPQSTLVSSLFFMCLPNQVLVYADCAINPEPNSEQLAEIAIQSAHTAKSFGIEPKVALLSYSTGSSGSGEDVEKVKRATALVRQRQPELMVDGPLQYDAALIESVAQQKAPQSTVAGHATVLIFPDLNTGNTTYKAVQRSAQVLSIGPILQGLNKPVNDLSRGATVDDIIYTIAITAIQSHQTHDR